MQAFAKIALAGGAILFAGPLAAQETLFDRYFAERDGALPCYGVTFTPEEREATTDRAISRFGVRHSRVDDLDGAPDVFELVFVWSLYGATTWAAVEAQCAMEGGVADCLIEGDGTNYSVAADGDAITFTANALNIEIMDALTEVFGDPTRAHTITLTKGDAALCETT